MVSGAGASRTAGQVLSVLALSSRFDGRLFAATALLPASDFQYSLCRVVLMVILSRIDAENVVPFSTRSVESF